MVDALAAKARASPSEPLGPFPAALVSHFRPHPVGRLLFAMGGAQLRWDARTTSLVPGPPLQGDEEEARRELARRFLHSLGPATPERFSRWAAVGGDDARATFDALAGELVAVESGEGYVLADDADDLMAAEPVAGTRLLAFGGDPVLQPGTDVLPSEAGRRREELPPWASTGLVLADGEPVASWGRRQSRVTLFPFLPLGVRREDEIEREARSLPVHGAPVRVAWRRPED
jgi:hypothetical protein